MGRLAGIGLAAVSAMLVAPAAPALGAIGYELAPENPPIVIGEEGVNPLVIGHLGVDQGNGRFYIAVASGDMNSGKPGQIQQYEGGTQTPASPFTTGLSNTYFTGIAIDSATHNVITAQSRATVPSGTFGENRIRVYSAAGAQLSTFAVTNGTLNPPMIAVDSTGRIFYPSDTLNTVQIFNSAGVLQGSIDCTGCPGGPFTTPRSIAIDAANNAYVLDIGTERVLKFVPSGGGYAYSALVQDDREARSVAVDPATGDLFVGNRDGTLGYHVVAYTSAGVEFDDFGGGVGKPPPPAFAELGAVAIAVNGTTHKLYIGDSGNYRVLTLNRTTTKLPDVDAVAASSVGQLTATVNASVNSEGHAVLDCEFEYVDHAEFLADGFTNADTAPCSTLPEGLTPVSLDADLTSLAPGTTYHYRAVAQSHAGVTTGNPLTFATLPVVSPTVTTEAAQKIVQAGGTLVGKVNPHGGVVSSCRFDYGTTISYGKQAPCPFLPDPETTNVTVQLPISGLTPATAYHVRFVVTTNAGTEMGDDKEFTTLPMIPPTVTGVAATAITETSATVAGTINPNGAAASCFFEYGTSTSYGSTAPCPLDPGGGTSAVSEALAFTGLTPGTTYHYRLVGSSKAGTAKGNDVTFATQSPPVAVPPLPPTPPPTVTPPKRLVCKKGFKKKKVRGKLKCVKKKKARRRS